MYRVEGTWLLITVDISNEKINQINNLVISARHIFLQVMSSITISGNPPDSLRNILEFVVNVELKYIEYVKS